MKNRITELFKRKTERILSIFFTAGYPSLNDTTKIIHLLQKSGADLIEIGIPFSDPLADGIIIQKSSARALANGMRLSLLFEQLRDIRKEISIPLLLMGYLNPVMQFGMENFVKKCKEIGIDGVIIPDLPLEVYIKEFKNLFVENNLSKVFIVTPNTRPERIQLIDSYSTGFIYLVSSSQTTGKKATLDKKHFAKIQELSLKNPIMLGFGITDNKTFNDASDFANGAIIGSAFISAISEGNTEEKIPSFISSILN